MNNDYLAPLGALLWGAVMFSMGMYCVRQYHRLAKEEDEEFFRQIYGPAGKPKKPLTAEPESPQRSAE